MISLLRLAALAALAGLTFFAAPLAAQPMSDGEACLEGSGRVHLDEAYCRRALSKPDLPAPERAALLTSRTSALLRLGDHDAAATDLARALALNPGSAKAHLLRGLMRRNAGAAAMDIVLADMDRAISLNPFFAEAMAQRGMVHLQTGDQDAALVDFDRALSIQPLSSSALFFKGVLRFQQRRFALAEGLFRRVLALAPVQHPIAALWLAAAAANQGGAAARALQPYLWWWEDGVWPAPLVQLWAGTVDADAAAAALTTQGQDARAQGAFFLAQWYLAKGEEAAARKLLGQVQRHPRRHMLEVIVADSLYRD